MKSFNQIYKSNKLSERLIRITPENFEELDKEIEDLPAKLAMIPSKWEWEEYAQCEGNTALDVVDNITEMYDENDENENYLILDDLRNPVGVITCLIQSDIDKKRKYIGKTVDNISLVAFKPNSITLVKDVMNLVKELRTKYNRVEWTVDNDNPIKRAYDRKIIEWSGTTRDLGDRTKYILKGIQK